MSSPSLDGRSGGAVSQAWRVAALGLLMALAAAMLAAVDLARVAYRHECASQAIRLDPAGLDVYASERAKATIDRPQVVFFGDSRAAMWPAPDRLGALRMVNRGIGYQTTAQLLLRLDEDLIPLLPAVVVLEGGVNDLKAIAAFPERRREIVADCETNLKRIVERCGRAGATVVLVTVFEIGDVALWRRPLWSSDVESAVREVNSFLATLAGPKVVLFDANSLLVDGGGSIRHAYQLDHLHLTPEGYAALNTKLVTIVTALSP